MSGPCTNRRALSSASWSGPYSPECVEGEFSEVPRFPDYMRRGFLCRAAGRYAARVQKTMRVGPGGPLGFLGRRAADRAPNVVQCALWGCFTDDLVAVRYVM